MAAAHNSPATFAVLTANDNSANAIDTRAARCAARA
jgi:hypothetical protein